MTLRCPQCASASDFSEGDIGPGGRMVRCGSCGTRWLARKFEDDPYERPALQRQVAAPAIAEPVIIEHVGAGFARTPPPHAREAVAEVARAPNRRTLKVVGTIFGALVALVVLRAPIVAALLAFGVPPAEVALLEFERVRSETVHLNGLSTLFVEGEIVNHSGADIALPAIRITLRAPDGGAVRSWLVEPSVSGLAAGRSVGFRSALASPPPDATQVSLNLAAREGI